jgi:DNA-binding protein H-NS
MTTLDDLLRQQRELASKIASLQAASREAVLAEIRHLMSLHGLTTKDVAAGGSRSKERPVDASRRTVLPKYRDEAGHTWAGRGLKPKWLAEAIAAGKSIDDFVIRE